jgi:predicted component of type VI protein secretion system
LVIYPVLKKTVEEEILKLLNTRKEEADKLLSSPERVWQTVFGNGDDDPKL